MNSPLMKRNEAIGDQENSHALVAAAQKNHPIPPTTAAWITARRAGLECALARIRGGRFLPSPDYGCHFVAHACEGLYVAGLTGGAK